MAGKHSHGVGRITAAIGAGPVAGVLATLALAGAMPAPGDVRYLIALVVALPAAVAGACLALLAKSGTRAWVGSLVVGAASSLALVLR